tara:strand:+ start:4093 stop:4749 length:657 start_codon:yes stop_codon:yes gene_type:complete
MPEAKKKNFYYNEAEVQEMLEEYKRTTIVTDTRLIFKDVKLEEKIVIEVSKIVDAIIMNYNYYVFEPYDDLKQHAILACYTNFLKFNKTKGSSFNFFSLISKISLLNYTTRKKKHRNHQDVEDQINLESKGDFNFNMFLDNLEETIFSIIDENFLGNKRNKYIKIGSLLIGYLNKSKKFVSKSDLYSWARSYGIKNSDVREFIKDIAKYNEELFSGVK